MRVWYGPTPSLSGAQSSDRREIGQAHLPTGAARNGSLRRSAEAQLPGRGLPVMPLSGHSRRLLRTTPTVYSITSSARARGPAASGGGGGEPHLAAGPGVNTKPNPAGRLDGRVAGLRAIEILAT